MKYVTFLLLITSTLSLNTIAAQNDANTIVNKAIKVVGGDIIANSTIEFMFRGKSYKAERNNGLFNLSKTFVKDNDTIEDRLGNNGFESYKNGKVNQVPANMVPRLSSSVNSVHYFSVLPYGLNDPAVNKFYLGETEIKGSKYHKIKITFNEEGGGEDFDDVFVYWVHEETLMVDYIAYSFEERYGKGYRFREAFNERYVNGIRFVDYNNYKPKSNDIDLYKMDVLFEENQLELLSKIELKNISVKI